MEDLAPTADSTHNLARNVKLKHRVAIFLLFACSFLYSAIYRDITVSYHDEATRVARGYLFELFIQRNFVHPVWQTIEGFDQPMLSQLVYGAVIYPQYLKEKALIGTKDFLTYMIDRSLFDTAWIANVPSLSTYVTYQKSLSEYLYWDDYWVRSQLQTNDEYIRWFGPAFTKTLSIIFHARRINILILSLSVLVFYWLAMKFFSPIPSLVMTLWFGTNTFIINASLRAHNEALFTLFFLLGLLLIIQLMSQKMLHWPTIIALGVTTGLCMASKLNGIMLSLMYAFVASIKTKIYVQPILHPILTVVLSTMTILIVGLSVFIALNPYTYPYPIQNTLRMYRYRYEVALKDGILGPHSALPRLKDRVHVYYRDFFGPQRAYIFSMPYPTQHMMSKHIASLLSLVIFVIGLASFISKGRNDHMRGLHQPFLWLFVVTICIVSLYLTLYRDTYMIPLSIFVLWFEGLGVYSIGAHIVRTLRK